MLTIDAGHDLKVDVSEQHHPRDGRHDHPDEEPDDDSGERDPWHGPENRRPLAPDTLTSS
jgi:hypothetical protein